MLKAKISPSDLISPAVDLNLAKLESDVILSSLAANLLPPHVDSGVPEEAVHTSEAGRIIDDYKERPLDVKRWTRVRQGVLVGGSAVWLGVEIGRAILEGGWKSVAFSVSWYGVMELMLGFRVRARFRAPYACRNSPDDTHHPCSFALPQRNHPTAYLHACPCANNRRDCLLVSSD